MTAQVKPTGNEEPSGRRKRVRPVVTPFSERAASSTGIGSPSAIPASPRSITRPSGMRSAWQAAELARRIVPSGRAQSVALAGGLEESLVERERDGRVASGGHEP